MCEGLLFCKVLMCSAVSFLYTSRSEGGGGVKWLFQLQGLGFGTSSWVCCVGCIWGLFVVGPFQVLKYVCQSCL